MAAIEWDAVVARLDDTGIGSFAASGSAVVVLSVAASLVGYRRVDLGEVCRLDATNASLVTQAVAHASNNDLQVTIQRPHYPSIADHFSN